MTPLFAAISGGLNCVTSAVLGIFVLTRNPRREANWSYGLFCFSIALWSFSYVKWQVVTTEVEALFWARALMLPAIFIPVFYVQHILSLFGPRKFKKPTLVVGYVFSVIACILVMTAHFVKGVSPKLSFPFWPDPGILFHVFLPIWATFVVWGVYVIAYNLRCSMGIKKTQLRYVLAATLIGWGGGATNFLLWYDIPIPPFGNILVSVYVALTAYAIVRYRLMNINLAITRTAVFVSVYALILGIPLAFAFRWRDELELSLGTNWWAVLLIAYALLATTAHYINLYLQQRAEEKILSEQRRYQEVLLQAAQGMTLIKELKRLLNLIVHLMTRAVRVKHAAVYLWDRAQSKFVPMASRHESYKNAPHFEEEDLFIRFLYGHRKPTVTEELQLKMQAERGSGSGLVETLKALKAAVVIPSFVEEKCVGFLVLGEKRSEALYADDDLKVFETLASQAALAIENAQFYEELQRTQADLFQTSKMASLGHMAGGMSHQINNRFHVLTILAGTMRSYLKGLNPNELNENKLDEIWKKMIETFDKVEANSLRGGEIVKTLLRFSRPTKEYEAVEVYQIVAMAMEVAQFRVNFDALEVIEEIPKGTPKIVGDLNQLADSFFNLISNANDAMGKKEEKIKANEMTRAAHDPDPFTRRMIIRARGEQRGERNWVVIELEDNGVGMTQEELKMLFIPFFTTKATANKGTGLGLYVIQRIVERHGGKIRAESTYGKGTKFIIHLPAVNPDSA